MKKLLNRIKGASAQASPSPDDEGFFSTVFSDQSDDMPRRTPWPARAAEVGAKPFEFKRGRELFATLWRADRYVAELSDEDLDHVSEYLQFFSVPSSKELIRQDEQGDYMIIVLEGTLAVDRVQPWGDRVRLAEARPGDMLGEMSLLDAGARFSACSTLTSCTLALVDALSLDRMMRDEPRLAAALLASLSRRLSLRLRHVSARLSALLSRT